MFRMILIEDEPRILRHLKEKFSTLSPDFKVVGDYNNGEDALVELHWTQPHAILTDIRMPIMNGFELLNKVKEQMPDIQCAILSGHDDFAYLREAIQIGITDYLLKPATDDDILILLGKMKNKLMDNQLLLEREVAKQITETSENTDQRHSGWDSIAKELFYHGNFVTVYAWSLMSDIPEGIHDDFVALLRDGEKFTPLPPNIGNEDILLFGLHTWSKERHAEWTRTFTSKAQSVDGLTVALAISTRGLHPVPALLAECKKQARMRSRFEGSCFWISDHEPEDIKPLLEPLQAELLRLAQFVTKQQKQLFAKELDSFFQMDLKPYSQ